MGVLCWGRCFARMMPFSLFSRTAAFNQPVMSVLSTSPKTPLQLHQQSSCKLPLAVSPEGKVGCRQEIHCLESQVNLWNMTKPTYRLIGSVSAASCNLFVWYINITAVRRLYVASIRCDRRTTGARLDHGSHNHTFPACSDETSSALGQQSYTYTPLPTQCMPM